MDKTEKPSSTIHAPKASRNAPEASPEFSKRKYKKMLNAHARKKFGPEDRDELKNRMQREMNEAGFGRK